MIIGIDAGYGYVKTKNTSFPSGVAHLSDRPPMMNRVVEFENRFYQVGVANDGITEDKTVNEDYYILSLAAIAEEMKLVGIYDAEIVLAVGVPLMRYGAEKDKLVAYMKQHDAVEFRYEDKEYKCIISPRVYVFPQGYAAIAHRLNDIKGPCYLVDMGTGTTEILPINADKSVDLGKAKTVQFGINNCIASVNARISNKYNSTLPEDSIIQVIMGRSQNAGLPDSVITVCEDAIRDWTEEAIKLLRQNKVNFELVQTFFVGGGAGVIKHFGGAMLGAEHNITFIEDICVNAKGYELLAKSMDAKYKNV